MKVKKRKVIGKEIQKFKIEVQGLNKVKGGMNSVRNIRA